MEIFAGFDKISAIHCLKTNNEEMENGENTMQHGFSQAVKHGKESAQNRLKISCIMCCKCKRNHIDYFGKASKRQRL